MWRARLDHQKRSSRVAVWLAAVLTLSGCSSFSGAGGDAPLTSRFTSLFGSNSSATQASASQGGTPFNEEDCPVVDIRAGAGTLSVSAKPGGNASTSDLRYQLTFGQMARQCTAVGSTLVMKVGVQGRVVLGASGSPGQIDVPLRYAVVREGPEPKTIVTKFKRVPTVVPPGETNVVFSDVEDNLSFPMAPAQDLDAYVVYVGFDQIGDPSEKKPVKTPQKPPPKRK